MRSETQDVMAEQDGTDADQEGHHRLLVFHVLRKRSVRK